MQGARPLVGNDDGVRKDGAGLTIMPFRIEQIDIEGKDHPGFELVANGCEGGLIGLERMKPVSGIFQGRQSVAVNAGLANPQACVVDNALYLVHGRDDRFSRAKKLHAAPERSNAAVINVLQLFVRLSQAECAFDMGKIPADLRMNSQVITSRGSI